MDRTSLFTSAVAGAVAGSLAWFVLKPFVDRQMEAGIREQLQTQLPQQLNAQLDTKLRQYGFTPETGRQVASLISAVSRTGVI
jgi:hypothetical protein